MSSVCMLPSTPIILNLLSRLGCFQRSIDVFLVYKKIDYKCKRDPTRRNDYTTKGFRPYRGCPSLEQLVHGLYCSIYLAGTRVRFIAEPAFFLQIGYDQRFRKRKPEVKLSTALLIVQRFSLTAMHIA